MVESLEKLTKSKAIASHRKMWHWIAEETLKRKRKVKKQDYFKAFNVAKNNIPMNRCYCCEYNLQVHGSRCENCPIDWGGNSFSTCTVKHGKDVPKGVFSAKGLFSEWECTHGYREAAEFAAKIAELPEKEMV